MYESGENYLETILRLEGKLGCVRSVDIANELNYTKPSISRAVGILKANGLLSIEKGGCLRLTEAGRAKANEIYERHCIIADFLVCTLGIDRCIAETDSCRIEHVISADTFEKVKEYVAANCRTK